MNLPPDIVDFLREFFFQQNRQAGQHDAVVSAVTWWISHSLLLFGIMVLVCLCVALTVILLYHPRMTRGALWLPAFGLFGGKPTLYLHTRPASVAGLFTHSHRAHRKKTGKGHGPASHPSHSGQVLI